MIRHLHYIELEVSKGDISNQPGLDAIVNAANPDLAPGGGVAGAIHSKAGPELYQECKQLAPIKPGEAVITGAYDMPNQHIIHCLGPVHGRDKPEEELLANCYINSLSLAEKYKLTSIGFPGISTGIYGYPSNLAVDVVLNTILAELPKLNHLKKIKFVVFSDNDLHLYKSKLNEFSSGQP